AWPALGRALPGRRRSALWLGGWTFGMTAFALVVHLPQDNEHKFVWQVFVPLAMLGGPGLAGISSAVRRRLGAPLTRLVCFLAFVAPSALFLYGYAADPAAPGAHQGRRAPGERRLSGTARAR